MYDAVLPRIFAPGEPSRRRPSTAQLTAGEHENYTGVKFVTPYRGFSTMGWIARSVDPQPRRASSDLPAQSAIVFCVPVA